MLKKLTRVFVKVTERFLPDAFLFAVILTIVTFVLALIFTDATPLGTLQIWGNGIWSLLGFTMQMCTIIVFGTAFAKTKAVEGLLDKICSKVHKPPQAYLITSLVAGIFSLLCWSTGLIVGGFMAKKLAQKVKGIHYPLIVAAGYSGFLTFQMGFTGSVSLLVATPGNFMYEQIGRLIPVSETMFAPYNIIAAVLVGLIIVPIIMSKLAPEPGKDEILELDPSLFEEVEEVAVAKENMTPAEKIEHARLLNIIIGAALLIYLVVYFAKGGSLTIDSTNLIFLAAAILLTDTPRRFLDNCIEGGKTLGSLALQFPFYAGIMSMMVGTGLASVIAHGFVNISNQVTFPLFTFLSAGLINFFVPSGGSQWSVQGPIMIEAAKMMDADLARTSMAVAWGDQWTNMLQPFWAAPLLAIAKLKPRNIMGYLVIVAIVSGVIFGLGIMFLP